ncbi:MAG: CatA-like O-acetyltransferase [Gemmatimonadota bacterium]
MSGPAGHLVALDTYPRRSQYALFRDYADPFFSLTVSVDVTGLYLASKVEAGPSFFLGTLFASMRAANAVPEFKQRLRPDGIWQHDFVGAGSAVRSANDTFGFAYFEWAEDFEEFHSAGRQDLERVAAAAGPLEPRHDRDDLIYHSVLPWLDFTSFKNARRGKQESIPRSVFGAYSENAARWRMPVGVEVHHALVDGLHVGRYLQRLQSELDRWS